MDFISIPIPCLQGVAFGLRHSFAFHLLFLVYIFMLYSANCTGARILQLVYWLDCDLDNSGIVVEFPARLREFFSPRNVYHFKSDIYYEKRKQPA